MLSNSLGKSKKEPMGVPPGTPQPPNNAALASQSQGSKPNTAPDPSAETFDQMIDELQPLEEMEGMAFGKGNRSLINLNLSFNRITDPLVIESLKHAPVINTILERVSFEGNPVEPLA